ncbi:MAG: hypothetical protein QNJ77_08285 [Acidimicrobiia bacterium]|nr:hypothetical protein [Acidimicrobiia bacterium]
MSYTIDRDAHLVRITGEGLLTDEEMRDCVSALRADPMLEPDMNTLSDMRHIEVAFTSEGVSAMVDIMRSTSDQRESARGAIVVGDDLAYGMARVFGTKAELSGAEPRFRVFRDMEAARTWLGLE